MDILSILGIIIAFVALLGGNFLEGGTWQSLMNGPAALIVFGGTIGAAMLQTPLTTMQRSLALIVWVLKPPVNERQRYIDKVCEWAEVARRSGLLGLEKIANEEKDAFSKKALELLIDGVTPTAIRRILESDLILLEQKDLDAVKVYASMGGYAPTIGIIGAVLGLIYVMRNLAEPSELGAGIAVAFVATIYGVSISNLFLLPIANKLTSYINYQLQTKEIIIEGVMFITDGENPRSIANKLSGYL